MTRTERHRVLSRVSVLLVLPAAVVVLAVGVTVFGGYVMRWRWTGYTRHRELWDVLHVMVLPVVLALLPVWVTTHTTRNRLWRVLLSTVAVAFAVVVVGGYALHWGWTGFAGNTLWDWLRLLVIPVSVALLPLWYATRRTRRRQWRAALAVFCAAFALVVFGGYLVPWAWTGFSGNTLYDWVDLLLVPLLLPLAVTVYNVEQPRRRAVAQRLDAAMRGVEERRPTAAVGTHPHEHRSLTGPPQTSGP